MIIEVSKEFLENHAAIRKDYDPSTPGYLLPVNGRFIDTNNKIERIFIGSDIESMDAFLKTLHLNPTAPAPTDGPFRSALGFWQELIRLMERA